MNKGGKMRSPGDLERTLSRLDGRGYSAYKDIKGSYDFGAFILYIDHVQGDPFAAPSRFRATVDRVSAGVPDDWVSTPARCTALADYLTRRFAVYCERFEAGSRGSGQSGLVDISRPRQEVLRRTSVIVDDKTIEVRFLVGLPAQSRHVLARQAHAMLLDEAPDLLQQTLLAKHLVADDVVRHLDSVEDQQYLRNALTDRGLVAFVADGSILPRASGVDQRPMAGSRAVAFQGPPSFRKTFVLPHAGEVTGMGIPRGITLIVGGGYHGKSTLLKAIELGVYDHVYGDGRERVVTERTAVKLRAEDGRRITSVNISSFLTNLPQKEDTSAFCTGNASGSTSQAANIMEALEMGCGMLLIDEDTSATNFMIRDHRMQELVTRDNEPITCFLDRVRQINDDMEVSTILVMGGSGDYFDVADHVIMMDGYVPRDVTEDAAAIAKKYQAERQSEAAGPFGEVTPRSPVKKSFDFHGRRGRVDAKGLRTILFGSQHMDLSAVEQLIDPAQTRAIADAVCLARDRFVNGSRPMREVVDGIADAIDKKGLDALDNRKMGCYAEPRTLEIAAAINRLRMLEVRRPKERQNGG
jgi:predicted ABC-class ATPase